MPRVEYRLSFENYLEMVGPRSKMPRYKLALISALVGFCGIVAGYGYLRIWPDTRTIIGGSLLGLGLLATFLALVLGFFAKPKFFRPDTALLEREYARSHADKRAIEFDEHGWRLFWYEGEDVRPWSRVRAIHELKTLLVLSTETTPYWLPKAALEQQGQLAKIKALAEGALKKNEVLFAVPMRPGVLVYVVAQLFHYWRLQVQSRVLWYSLATLFFYWILASDSGAAPHSAWLVVLVPVFFCLCESLYYLRNYFFANWSEAAREAEIMSDCIGYRTETVRWIVGYRLLIKSRESPGAFLLYFDPSNFHLIPKKGFSREQIVQFRKLISTHP
jgi:hypothetical protein